MLTGESVPVDKAGGDGVVGATLNTSGRLLVEVTRVGRDTALARIADSGPACPGHEGTRYNGWRTGCLRCSCRSCWSSPLATFAVWALAGEPGGGLTAAVAVLVIACPCALGLATPTALLVGTGRAAQLGIVIREAGVLEATRGIDMVRARQDRDRHHRAR